MNPAMNTARAHLENEEKCNEKVTFSRMEFLDFIEWVGVKGVIEKTDSGKESFTLYGNMGNTFTLDVIIP